MVFLRYFLKRYFSYFFIINILLTGVFNIIEFFEKLVRITHTDVASIAYFIALNLLPSFSDLMPISAWLATCLLIREFNQQKEWETLLLLNINYKKLAGLFLCAGLIAVGFGLVLYEQVTAPLVARAQQFKVENFKQEVPTKIFKKWYQLDGQTFCYFDMVDLSTREGLNLLVLYVFDDFSIKKIIRAARFRLNISAQTITILQGDILDGEGQILKEHVQDRVIMVPNFFVQVNSNGQSQKLVHLVPKLFTSGGGFAYAVGRDLLYVIMNRIFFYLQILLYALLTFLLFALLDRSQRLKWIALSFPYVFVIFLTYLGSFFFQNGLSAWLFMLPSLLFLLIVIFLFFLLERKPASIGKIQ
ncbi:MAG: LptF/LptG family permease [bacterium]